LHLNSDTPYTEQGAIAYDEIDGDISANVQISGTVERQRPGLYRITYTVVNSEGLEGSATREVHILNPNVSRPQRTTFNFSGQGKAVSTASHRGVIVDDAGFMDFSVTSIDKSSSIRVTIRNRATNTIVFNNTYAGVGGTQFWVERGTYDIDVTVASGNGNIKYGIRLVTLHIHMKYNAVTTCVRSHKNSTAHIYTG
jgi:hypothetical protein